MSLKIRLTEDMKTAMRAKDQVSLGTIRLINAAVKQFEVGRTHRSRRCQNHRHPDQNGQTAQRQRENLH